MVRPGNSEDKAGGQNRRPALDPPDHPDIAALLQVQRDISALSPEHHAALLEILGGPPRCAESEMDRIAHMNKAERRRLGMLLAKADILPEWRVVQSRTLRAKKFELRGDQLRLYNFLSPTGTRRHENNIIRHLWPHKIKPGEDVGLNETLRARLRQLMKRANANLNFFQPGYEIKRVKGKRELYIHLDGRNLVEVHEDRLRGQGKHL
jgi:hypothetical protein